MRSFLERWSSLGSYFSIFFKKYIYLILEREEGRRKRGRETLTGCLLHAPTGGPACIQGMCPDW